MTGAGTNANAWVNGAWWPGVDKITLVSQPVDAKSGAFLPWTNNFTDTYLTNRQLKTQTLARVIRQPDFLFTVTNNPDLFNVSSSAGSWINDSFGNGHANGEGPGVIAPPVQIAFGSLGLTIEATGDAANLQILEQYQSWASFDDSTKVPVVYPLSQGNRTTLILYFSPSPGITQSSTWFLGGEESAPYAFQTSTDLANWSTFCILVNNHSVSGFIDYQTNSRARFYRLLPF